MARIAPLSAFASIHARSERGFRALNMSPPLYNHIALPAAQPESALPRTHAGQATRNPGRTHQSHRAPHQTGEGPAALHGAGRSFESTLGTARGRWMKAIAPTERS